MLNLKLSKDSGSVVRNELLSDVVNNYLILAEWTIRRPGCFSDPNTRVNITVNCFFEAFKMLKQLNLSKKAYFGAFL